MPFPLGLGYAVGQGIGTVGSALFKGADTAARSLGRAGISSAFSGNNPGTREVYYLANAGLPNLIADPGELMDLFHAGRLTQSEFARQLRFQGIDVTTNDAVAEVWRRVVELHRPTWSLESYRKWQRQGVLPLPELQALIRKHGISLPEHINLFVNDYELIPLPVIHEAYLLNQIDIVTTIRLLGQHGFRQEDAEKIVNSWSVRLSPIDALHLKHRGVISDNELTEYLFASGITREVDRERIIKLGQVVPTPSDAVLFAVHDVFEPHLVGRVEATEEYSQQIGLQELFQATGIGKTYIQGISPSTNDIVDVGLLYWLAHYRHVSPTQVYDMFHRLRPGRLHKWALPDQNPAQVAAMETGLDTVRRLLKLDDYNPFWRDRLAAIAYRVVGRIDVRRMYKVGTFGPPQGSDGFNTVNGVNVAVGPAERELVESYKDMGYSPPDAVNLAFFTAAQNTETTNSRIRQSVKTAVCAAVETGLASDAQNTQILIDAGVPQAEAETIVQACKLRAHVNQVKRAVKYIRRAYLGGRITLDNAVAALNQIGINQQAITRYLEEWTLDLSARAKEPQAAQLCEWYGNGLITVTDFNQRLLRLGWTQADATRVINHCLVGIQARTKREAERAANIVARKAKEKLSEDRRALQRFLSGRTDTYIKQWYDEGTITIEDVRQTLVLRGWSKHDIERYICSLTGELEPCNPETGQSEETVDDTGDTNESS